jgi:hypothetical protein
MQSTWKDPSEGENGEDIAVGIELGKCMKIGWRGWVFGKFLSLKIVIGVGKRSWSFWFKVRDGSGIFLWCDNWHPTGYLLNKYEYMTVYDAGHSIGPKLSSIIRGREW